MEFSNSLPDWTGLGGRALSRSCGSPVPGATQKAVLGAASVVCASDLVADGHVWVSCNGACFVRLVVDPTALAEAAVVDEDMYLPANTYVVLHIGRNSAGVQYTRIAGITSGAAVNLFVTPMEG